MKNRVFFAFLILFAGSCAGEKQVQTSVSKEQLFVCVSVDTLRKPNRSVRCIRYIKFSINDSTNRARYEPWLFWDVTETKDTLASDGYEPGGVIEGTVRISDSMIVLTGEIIEAQKRLIETQPKEKQQWYAKEVRKRLGLDKAFKRYVTHNKLDTLWCEKGTNHFFVKKR
jgi:hypothetical protein